MQGLTSWSESHFGRALVPAESTFGGVIYEAGWMDHSCGLKLTTRFIGSEDSCEVLWYMLRSAITCRLEPSW